MLNISGETSLTALKCCGGFGYVWVVCSGHHHHHHISQEELCGENTEQMCPVFTLENQSSDVFTFTNNNNDNNNTISPDGRIIIIIDISPVVQSLPGNAPN